MSGPAPLHPAKLGFAADGTPWSAAFGDVYHSAEGGLAQARHVFLQGNGLPERWRGRRHFTVLETGFGLGISFCATWQAWRDDPARCERLHFVSIEKHPFQAAEISFFLEKQKDLCADAPRIAAQWPLLVPGMHRLEFEAGRVVLTLAFGDIADTLPQLGLTADAIFLDGFSPAKNPAMWEPRLLRHLGRLAAPGCTVATWSAASAVREALQGAGFHVEKAAGFGAKRDMLRGRLIPRPESRAPARPAREAIVVGAGIAGAAAGERLAARGWRVTVIERHPGPAMEASGNPAGVFHPVVSPDDSLFARLTRASFTYLLRHWSGLDGLAWDRCGVLQLARDDEERRSQEKALARLGYPADYARFDARRGGVWYPQAGWVKPRSLVELLLSGIKDTKFGVQVHALEFTKHAWHAKDEGGDVIASAPVVILANAADALRLAPQPEVRLRRIRGQLTLVPAIAGLAHVLLSGGMVLPGIDGVSVAGASFDLDDDDPLPRVGSHEGNLARLEQLVPGATAGLDPATLEGRVGFRAVVRDRLPLVGALPDARAAGLYGAFAYGSRGLLWASLAGELIASMLEGEPLPVERALASAVDPARFALRAARRGTRAAPG